MSLTKFKFIWPERSGLSNGAFEIVKILRKAGTEAFIAGGAVRDALLKRPITEIDIATSAWPVQVKKLFKKTIPTGEKHGTITVRLKNVNYEVTTFRVEGKYLDFRRPSKVKFITSAAEDACRRDFTVNALFYDPSSNEVMDYVNGIADISHKRIRFIGKPEERIREDALRLLRAVRFATTLRFDLARETRNAIQKHTKLIAKISAERTKAELDKIMMSKRAAIGIGLLDIVGLLEHILPELKNCQEVSQPRNQHSEGDVYAHSLLALEQAQEDFDLATRYAVLFHDLGKPSTRTIRDGKITFYDHMRVGEEAVRKICKRLKFSRHETDKIGWLVRSHMVPNDFAHMRLGRRRHWGLQKHFPDLLKVYLADARASIPAGKKPDKNPRAYREGLKILKEIQARPALRVPLLTGHEVMKILRLKSGPLVGKAMRLVEDAKLAGRISTKAEAKIYLQRNKNLVK